MRFKVSGNWMMVYSNSKVNDQLPDDGFRVQRFEFHADFDQSAGLDFFLIRNLHVYELIDQEK